MFQNIIFDWSGVINDNSYAVYQTVLDILSTKGIYQELPYIEFRKQWKQPYMDFYHKYIPDFTREEQSPLYKKILPKYEENKIFPGMEKLIKKIFDKNINCFVISSDYPKTLFKQLDIFKLENFFKEIIHSSYNKSNDVRNLIKKYNFDLSKSIFIGDSNHEIDSGRENGIKSCGVTWGLSDEDNLLAANPDFIAHNLSELENILLKPVIII